MRRLRLRLRLRSASAQVPSTRTAWIVLWRPAWAPMTGATPCAPVVLLIQRVARLPVCFQEDLVTDGTNAPGCRAMMPGIGRHRGSSAKSVQGRVSSHG
ncbi:hypothetical protein XhhCFBP4925_00195 [Xanthomonas hortorum pv. hederae]|nr:hypothetical protein XhhCFBP4925_00195 [Xanthomonas hortorum pv. hederae]